ncbi:protein kinase [Actinoplanes sp. NPDC051346]|uniref:serine/threonine protein kinase n=1 Tax=Actinoplanes sp. NPDC051346 TaxID=3155048 RepID=UPI0034215D10
MAMPLLPGDTRQIGRYRLLARLGQGGMGTVYLGETPEGRPVALKMVRPEHAHDPEYRGRFRSEVNRAQQVPPFSTAEVLDADPDHDPPYLVVEYVNGPSLHTILQDQGPLTGAALHTLAIGTATALTAIHGAGVIHRDLKPANVLLPPGGIKVIDFGIARPQELTSHHTATHHMVGTIAYMAPERFEPAHAHLAGTPADIFAWGVLIAHAATGRTPFAGDTPPATAMRILTRQPDLDGVTGPLRDLVERALAKDPADRPTARQLLDALVDGGPVVVHPQPDPQVAPTPSDPPASPGRSRRLRRASAPSPASTLPAADLPVSAPSSHPAVASSPSRPHRAVAAAAVLVLLGAAGFAGKYLTDDSSPTDLASGTSVAASPTTSPSASVPPSPRRPSRVQGFFAGGRRAVIHFAELDENMYLYPNGGEAETTGTALGAGGEDDETLFALEPFGVDYQIKWLSEDYPDHCLGVRINPGVNAILVTAPCHQTDATVFEISATGKKDDAGRPTYYIYSNAYGAVEWSEEDQRIILQEVGDATIWTTFAFLDRGPLVKGTGPAG